MRLHSTRTCSFVIVLACAACTRHHEVRYAPAELVGGRVEVRTRDGRKLAARGEAGPGGLVWRGEGGGLVQSSEVEEVVRVSHARGAGQGLLIGFIGGAVFGAAAGLLSGDDDGDCLVCFTAGEKALVLGGGIGAVSGLVGLVGGAIAGSHHVYRFGPEAVREREPRFRPNGPPGSVAGLTFAF